MITYEQAKTLVKGQVAYTIQNNKIKEVVITSITFHEERVAQPSRKAAFRIGYKLKGGTVEYYDWALVQYEILTLYLTKEEVAEALISDLYIRRQELEDQLTRLEIRINEAKKFGGLK